MKTEAEYSYEYEREAIFTDKGQRAFLQFRDKLKAVLETSGAVTLYKAMDCGTGDSWQRMSYVDRMVELGELIRVEPAEKKNPLIPTGNRGMVFMAPG